MNHDYKAALEAMNDEDHVIDLFDKDFPLKQTIINALKLAEKVTGEPSVGMLEANMKAFSKSCEYDTRPCEFKAMISQAQKEIDDETA